MNDKFDKEGKPITLLEWGRLFQIPGYQIIEQTTLPNGKWVSTVWLGLEHGYRDNKPLIFETMVFSAKGNCNELDCERYATLEEAKAGHQKMVLENT